MIPEAFNIPIVLFIFKRKETLMKIISQIRKIKPQKIYLLSDGGRDDEEIRRVSETRNAVEEAIDWPCDVIKNYAEKNRGVFENIGLGARWVLEREEVAIFLEDDNYPEITFFNYCKELLEKYKNNDDILWICGSNYLGNFDDGKSSYYFTKQLLPCGWASWSKKYLHYYEENFMGFFKQETYYKLKKTYSSQALFRQEYECMLREVERKKKGERYSSWDYHMDYSVRIHNKLGIVPNKNQIKNIGVDQDSTHGGTSLNMIMTKRFCENPTYQLEFPLIHPNNIKVNKLLEKKLEKIILFPFILRIKGKINVLIKKIFKIEKNNSLSTELKKKMRI